MQAGGSIRVLSRLPASFHLLKNATTPFPRKTMHIVSAFQNVHGFGIVRQDEVDYRFEFD